MLWIGAIDINWRSYRYFSVVGCGLVLLISIGEAIGIFCCGLVLLISVGEAIGIFCCGLVLLISVGKAIDIFLL
jgi:hypothetical protein